MSGALAAVIAASAPAAQIVVTAGTLDSATFGYSGGFGAISPEAALGETIDSITAGTTSDFRIQLDDPALPQNHFRRVLVQTTAGDMRHYFTADATHFTGLVSGWRWGNGSSPVWTATGTRAVQLFR